MYIIKNRKYRINCFRKKTKFVIMKIARPQCECGNDCPFGDCGF
jgi:hypothetical protein